MELRELKEMVDKAYQNSQVTRQKAADDLVFYWVTNWDDALLQTSDLSFRGEFNIIRKAARRIMADLRTNPPQVNFEPIDDTRDDAADVIDGLYRKDDRANSTQESYSNAMQEQVTCGVGAWELYTDYESIRGKTKNQIIKRRPIHEANNVIFWDPDSKMMDKSDASYVCVLVPYSKEAYEELVEEMTGDEYKCVPSDFAFPQYSFTFPWTAGNFEWVFVGEIYCRKKETDVIVTLLDPIMQEFSDYYESDVMDKIDELVDSGHMVVQRREVERYRVTKYIASGAQILNGEDGELIAGEHIPVVPVYGERAFVEGQETWEGVVRLAKDPQRLRNFLLSYIADIASRSPRPKPIFAPEQIQGLENMYQLNGAENNLPYYLMHRKTANGEDLPIGPIAQMPEQQVPASVLQLVQMTREAVSDVASEGMPKDYSDIDISGVAIEKIDARIDQESVVYQENMKHAKRRDAEIYASMAAEIYDAPREVTLIMPDGTRKKERIIKSVIDRETGEPVVLNDLRNAQFEVYADIGPTYQSQKDKLRKELAMLIQTLPPDDPMRQLYMYKHATLMDGTDTNDIRDYARRQMLLAGFKQPETPEDEAIVAEAQDAGSQPDAATLMAMAEMEKAKAAQMREQNSQIQIAGDIEKKRADTAVDIFNAQTSRFTAQTNAEKAGADIQLQRAELIGKQYAAVAKELDKPVAKSMVHGRDVTERDIQDTMRKYGMSREQVLAKLSQMNMLSHTLGRVMNG